MQPGTKPRDGVFIKLEISVKYKVWTKTDPSQESTMHRVGSSEIPTVVELYVRCKFIRMIGVDIVPNYPVIQLSGYRMQCTPALTFICLYSQFRRLSSWFRLQL